MAGELLLRLTIKLTQKDSSRPTSIPSTRIIPRASIIFRVRVLRRFGWPWTLKISASQQPQIHRPLPSAPLPCGEPPLHPAPSLVSIKTQQSPWLGSGETSRMDRVVVLIKDRLNPNMDQQKEGAWAWMKRRWTYCGKISTKNYRRRCRCRCRGMGRVRGRRCRRAAGASRRGASRELTPRSRESWRCWSFWGSSSCFTVTIRRSRRGGQIPGDYQWIQILLWVSLLISLFFFTLKTV